MRLDHPIFQGPRRVEIALEPIPTPKHYRGFGDGVDLPAEIPSWRVLAKDYPEIEPGLVCSSFAFEESPDCEWISGGTNSKNVDALAIARQANVFFWGFSGAPADMTPSARAAMVNAIAYMDQFDGSAPLLGRKHWAWFQWTREWALTQAVHRDWRIARGEETAETEACFPKHVIDECGREPGRVLAWYRARLDYLVTSKAGTVFDVDPDCVALGVGNRDPRFFEAVLARLDRDPEDAVARRLLDRYARVAEARTVAELRAWHERVRPYLFFTDKDGFVWRVDEAALAAGRPRARRGTVYAAPPAVDARGR